MVRKRIPGILLSLVALVFILFSPGCQHDAPDEYVSARYAAREQPLEEKIYWKGSIDEDFDGSSIIVMMDKYAGGINKKHETGYFGRFEKKYIKDLTTVTGDIKNSLFDTEKFRQILVIRLPEDNKKNVVSAIQELEKIEGILYAGPNFFYYPASVPDDTFMPDQWGLNDTYGIQAADAWDITTGSNNVQVGIIDTGIASHPDLNAALVEGENFVSVNNDANDTHGHGTHVAGIVGAVGNNNMGISGVCWNVDLVPLKIADTGTGNCSTSGYVIEALTHARDNNIPIVNFSWGGFSDDPGLENAIASYEGLFVCVAMNESTNNDIFPVYPPNFDLPNMITVGAVDSDGNCSSFSNYGFTTVDLFAPGGELPPYPGEGILSTYPTSRCDQGLIFCESDGTIHHSNGYHYASGTSMAAPHVAGVAALLLSVRNDLSPQELKSFIMASVDQDSRLADLCVSGGRLNAYQSLLSSLVPISIDTLQGMTVPVFGYTPVSSITETSQYTGTVSWTPNHSVFQAETAYTATITLTPKQGYTLSGIPANFFTVAGATSVTNTPDSRIVTVVFPEKSVIGSFDMVIDSNTFDWARRMGARLNRSIVYQNGPIGKFTLYTNGTWDITEAEDELQWYVLPFDPENDSFFNAMEWDAIPSGITDYLTTVDMVANVPLTVIFPMEEDSNCFYAAYSMGISVTGDGVDLIGSDDDVEVLKESISYAPLPIWAVPVEGVLTPDN